MNEISTRSVLRYPGGKFRARKTLDTYVQKIEKPHEQLRVLSPFFGGGSFELHLTGRGHFIVGYDKFFLLSNFWKQLNHNNLKLSEKIEEYYGKINSDIFKKLQQQLKEIEDAKEFENPLAAAAEFFVVNRCSFSGSTLSGGFSKDSSTTRFTKSIIERVEEWSNPNLEVSHGDCHEILENIPEVDLLFLDPPYLLAEDRNTLYGVNGNHHKGFDHSLFNEQMKNIDKPFILTYNNDSILKEMWKDYNIYEAEWSYGMNKTKKSSEIIITNF